MKANWVVHFMRRKCILNNVIKGQKEGRKDRCDGKKRKKI
jgi:hypothetical protein